MNEKMLSIVIPVLNEEQVLPLCLKSLATNVHLLPSCEVIVVDGGSQDKTVHLVPKGVKQLNSEQGRAKQMNLGAAEATGEWLLFLHADSFLTAQACKRLNQVVSEDKVIGGCFSQKIDHPNIIYKWIAWTGNVRAKFKKIYYGDQGIFVRRDIFEQLKGFPEVPIMEDVVFSSQLKQKGLIAIQKEKIISSARRWEKMGIFKTTQLYSKIKKGYAKGIPLEKLKEIYLDVR